MQNQLTKPGTSRALLTVFLVLFLSACGGGGGGDGGGGGGLSQSNEQLSGDAGSDSNIQSPETIVDTGRFDLEWTAPVSRTDGSPLPPSEINGFTVYYGKSPGNYTYYADVSDSTAQDVTVTDVPVGKYYVVMTTYDSGGRESGYSPMITKTVT
jgi:hypothetical protein